MIFRLSHKLNAKIKAGNVKAVPPDDDPFADWSAHLFAADRAQYIIVTNTTSLYSLAMFGKGITNASYFIQAAMSAIREFMEQDGQEFVYHRFIAPASATVHFAKPLNRSVTGSMNDLVYHAKTWLVQGDIAPFSVGFKLNEIPFSSLMYLNPRESFKKMGEPAEDKK